MSCKGAVWRVPTQEVALVHGGDVGEDGEDVLLEHTTRLTFSNTATLRKALEERGGGQIPQRPFGLLLPIGRLR